MIAPGAELKLVGRKEQDLIVNGFSMFSQMRQVERATFNGQTLITDSIKKVKKTQFVYDPLVSRDLPRGIEYASGPPRVSVRKISESYVLQEE